MSYRILLLIWIFGLQSFHISYANDPAPDFRKDIQPILAEYCYACHGPDENKRKADLRFDIMDVAIEIGAVTPGDSTDSFLVDRIFTDDPEEIMPPPKSKKELSEEQKQLLVDWINEGAAYSSHWSFEAVNNVSIPEPKKNADWIQDPLDAFILTRLEEEELPPATQADKETLIRRLYFDLTGLPPSVSDTDAFLKNKSPRAYEKVVDRLLASPRYGEHMAALWLDIARYADTYGYQADVQNRVWPWRDWVIRAFNENIPYDQFVIHQLAGDLLPEPTQDQVLATAFNRLHRQTNEGGSFEEEFRVEYAADRTQTFSTAFMGLTLECARCHDHKFDPISQKEYYQLVSFFNNIDESGMYSHFTDAIPPPAGFLFQDKEEKSLDRLIRSLMKAEKNLDKAITKTENRYTSWLNSTDKLINPLSPIVHLSFDEEPKDRKIVNHAVPDSLARVSNEYTLEEGIQGRALRFDGDTSVSMNETARFDRYDPFSISLWLNINEYAPTRIVLHRSHAEIDAASRGYEILLKEGHVVVGLNHFWPGNAIRIKTLQPISLNTWTHVTAAYDGSSQAEGLKIYVNGIETEVEVIRDKLNKTLFYEREGTNPPLQLGTRFRDVGLKHVSLDEVLVFDICLTSLESKAVFTGDSVLDVIEQEIAHNPKSRLLQEYYSSRMDNKTTKRRKNVYAKRKETADYIEGIRQIMVMGEMEQRRPTYILERGEYTRKGETVTPNTPAQLPPLPENAPNNRLGLAQWLVSPDHPLTSRVAVNRLWQQCFGRGLVDTPEDFGIQGSAPSHPELLDHLAYSFMESGWDVKAMLRRMVLSSTYQQTSKTSSTLLERDPENTLLARGSRYRHSAEEIRDTALAASGLLTPTIGGPSVKPYQPAGIWKDSSSTTYTQSKGDALYRRSMYTFIKRTVPPPSLLTFDATSREVCIARRESTITPLQALVLLNDPQYVEASRVLAERAMVKYNDKETATTYIFRELLTRKPTQAELKILLTALQEQHTWFANHPDQAKSYLTVGDHPPKKSLDPINVAAMTALTQVIMNHDEFQVKQ